LDPTVSFGLFGVSVDLKKKGDKKLSKHKSYGLFSLRLLFISRL
jgi:hypothetical protein